MELVCRPSRRAVSSVLAETSVCPGLLLQLSVCVHLCVISSALSVPVHSLQKSLGLVIPLLATLHNICHDTIIRDPATSARDLAFVSSHTHTHTHHFLLPLLLSFFLFSHIFSSHKPEIGQLFDQTVLMFYPLTRHWSTDNIRLLLSEEEFCTILIFGLKAEDDFNTVILNERGKMEDLKYKVWSKI